MVAYKDVNGVPVEMTAEEEADLNARIKAWDDSALDRSFKNLRFERNNLLQECDWTDLPNAVLTDEKKTEWQTYRTNLRDLTNGLTTVEEVKNVEYPTKPEK